jgi:hypothetical protein
MSRVSHKSSLTTKNIILFAGMITFRKGRKSSICIPVALIQGQLKKFAVVIPTDYDPETISRIYSRLWETGNAYPQEFQPVTKTVQLYLPRSQQVHTDRRGTLQVKLYPQKTCIHQTMQVTNFIRTFDILYKTPMIQIAEFNFVNGFSHNESERMISC